MVTAAAELFPDAAVFIEHSAPTLGATTAGSAGTRRSAPRIWRPSPRACVPSSPPTCRSTRPKRRLRKPWRSSRGVARLTRRGCWPIGNRTASSCTSCADGRTTSRVTCCPPPAACAASRCIRWAPALCCSTRTRPSPASWRASSRTRSCSRRLPRLAPGSTPSASGVPAPSTTRSRRAGCRKCRWSPKRCTRRTSVASRPTSSRAERPCAWCSSPGRRRRARRRFPSAWRCSCWRAAAACTRGAGRLLPGP